MIRNINPQIADRLAYSDCGSVTILMCILATADQYHVLDIRKTFGSYASLAKAQRYSEDTLREKLKNLVKDEWLVRIEPGIYLISPNVVAFEYEVDTNEDGWAQVYYETHSKYAKP